MAAARSSRRIVVGVDGSPASMAALRWAVDHACEAGTVVEAVHAWSMPPVPPLLSDGLRVDPNDLHRWAEETLDMAVATVGEPPPGVRLEKLLVTGHARDALLDASRDADLLVVGARGHGGFVGLLLGSVSSTCVRHAPCPVVVVPGDGEPTVEPSAAAAPADVSETTLEVLDEDRCRQLLASRRVGRLGVIVHATPEIFPVNYVLDGDTVVVRVGAGTKLGAAAQWPSASFQVDEVEEESRTGWSVLVTGRLEEVNDRAERERLEALPLSLWAPGPRYHWLRLRPLGISGRALRRGPQT